MCNIDTVTLLSYSFITTMCLNLSLFFLKTTVNLLHNCTKNFVISLVNTTNRGFRKNEIFICITNWSAGVALNFWQGSVHTQIAFLNDIFWTPDNFFIFKSHFCILRSTFNRPYSNILTIYPHSFDLKLLLKFKLTLWFNDWQIL